MTSPTERLSLRDLVKYALMPSSFDILFEFDPGVPIEEVPRWHLIAWRAAVAICITVSSACAIVAAIELLALLSSS